ncbi:uncharacterized protein LOC127242278 [Andrographis paniculata]|uniref:uncharacterized protein LOC127242278 n=1 Tax=Andrographis paniculata TaxID=175694 RepID=UPI0021E7A5DE|nr:uncharacterized protein LOC127242278 [Andrographis paniculata]
MATDSSKDSSLRICHLLMAALFALSTCFQFNDPDWYLWIPLYAAACAANLKIPNSKILAKFGFWVGAFLFVKVAAIEGVLGGTRVAWSLGMKDRVVRETFGSGLVVSSMFLCLENPSSSNHSGTLSKYGLKMLVGVSYGLSLFFFAFQYGEMRY